MLPSNLLSVWKRKDTIQPRFAKASEDTLQVAESLIDTYKQGMGKKKKAIKTAGEKLEDEGYEFHFVRSLALLLDRRSTFKCSSVTDPLELRRKIFQETGKTSPATDHEQRKIIIEKVAAEMEMSEREIEEAMYADLESELTLKHFDTTTPQELLKNYNLSLAQTLLFDSTELKFTVSANWQNIFFMAKRLGLIYEAFKSSEFWVKVDGPASLFKLSRRYGTAIAKLLPAIIASPEWTIEAKILWKFTNRIYNFKLESWRHKILFKSKQMIETYDSSVEENFASRFQALNSEWKLEREPEPVIAGQHVIIPDFSFKKENVKLYMEIVGFWTREYLQRKVAKLGKTEEQILVAVDENLACERVARLETQQNLEILYYRKKIPLSPIVRYLQEAYKEIHAKHLKLLKDLNVTFTEPVIKFKDFAARTGVSSDAVRALLLEKTPENYVILPDRLIRKDKLEQIREHLDREISKTGKIPLTKAIEIGQKQGIDLTSAVETLGYRILWHGINAEKAVVTKPKNITSSG